MYAAITPLMEQASLALERLFGNSFKTSILTLKDDFCLLSIQPFRELHFLSDLLS